MPNNKFSGDMTYEEWAPKQNSDSLEFKIIQGIHRSFPDWNLEEVKKRALDFMSSHLRIVQDIRSDYYNLDLNNIEKLAAQYIDAGRVGNKIHLDTFGEPCTNYDYLARWNLSLINVINILTSPSKYKYEDEKGHNTVQRVELAGKRYGFAAEKQLDRDIKKIVEMLPERFETKSDLMRELLFKGIEIYTIMNAGDLGNTAKDVLLDIKPFRLKAEEESLNQKLVNIKSEFGRLYEKLERFIYNRSDRDILEEFREDFVKYLDDILNHPCRKQDKEEIRACIKSNRDLEKILDRLERDKLVSREYMDSILKEAKVIPYVNLVSNEDMRPREKG